MCRFDPNVGAIAFDARRWAILENLNAVCSGGASEPPYIIERMQTAGGGI